MPNVAATAPQGAGDPTILDIGGLSRQPSTGARAVGSEGKGDFGCSTRAMDTEPSWRRGRARVAGRRDWTRKRHHDPSRDLQAPYPVRMSKTGERYGAADVP